MEPTMTPVPTNIVTETLLTGNVTLNLVALCFIVASVAVGITLWAVYRFQTKDDARESEERLATALKNDSDGHRRALEETKVEFNRALTSIHDHMTSMKNDAKIESRQLQTEVSNVRSLLATLSNDIGYLRGKSER